MRSYSKPLLFLIFNRPDVTTKVWAEIRKIKPMRLYIAADGPRKNRPSDKEKCEETRRITEKVSWKCRVKRLYRDKNLGCGKAVSSAIDWFFKNEEDGIILEDDVLPNEPFFVFCEKMLDKYRNDKNVMHITGGNFLENNIKIDDSYFFSKYVHIWGWATWRRAWKNYDFDMSSWNKSKNMKFLNYYKTDFMEKMYWKTLFNAIKNKMIDTWDYQWVYSVWKNKGIGIIPAKNLVKNIGFGKDATHKTLSNVNNVNTYTLNFPYKHPNKEISEVADKYTRDKVFRVGALNIAKQYFYYKVRQYDTFRKK